MSSKFVEVRDAIEGAFESIFSKQIAAGAGFAHAVAEDAKAEAPGDLATAFEDAATTFAAAPGTFTVRAIASLEVFALTLLGEAYSIVKKDAPILTATPSPAPAEPAQVIQ